MTRREYLASLGLAKPGTRGRFSKQAVAALAKAEAEGMVFDSPPPAARPRSSKPKPVSTKHANVQATDLKPEIKPVPKPVKARKIGKITGYTIEGYKVVSDLCFACNSHVDWCRCPKITPSSIVATLDPDSHPYC